MSNEEPVLQVVRGTPTAEELAALVGVVLTQVRGPSPSEAEPSRWARSSRPGAVVGAVPTARGRHAWRASALPR